MSRMMIACALLFMLVPIALTRADASGVLPSLPPEMTWTGEESAFVLHVNLERLIDSALKSMLAHPLRIDDPEDRVWRKLADELSLELGRDVRSVTLITVGPLNTDFVTVVRMSERADELPMIMAEHVPGYRVTDIEGYEVHSWAEIVEEKRRHIYGHLHTLGENERMWIIAMNWEHLLEAIAHAERLPKHAPDHALPEDLPPLREESALYLVVPPSAFAGQGNGIGLSEDQLRWISMDISATATTCSLRMVGGLTREGEAIEVAQLAQGMLAFSRIALRDKEEMQPIVRLINQASVRTDGSTVTLELTADRDLLNEVFAIIRPHIGAARDGEGRFHIELGAQEQRTKSRNDE